MQISIPFYISPCPNDTFIMYAMNTRKVSLPFELDVHFADVEKLNQNLLYRKPCVSKISVATLAIVDKEYTVLQTGAAMGIGCGPLVVSKRSKQSLSHGRIAIPGIYTTANALLTLQGIYQGERVPMLFSEIPYALQSGTVDIGVLIHESRFEYQQYGLQLIDDLGLFWETTYNIPLPLGVFVIHNSLLDYKDAVEEGMTRSLQYAYQHYEEALQYCAGYAQEVEKKTLNKHIEMFVNQYTFSIGKQGESAIQTLLNALQCKERVLQSP